MEILRKGDHKNQASLASFLSPQNFDLENLPQLFELNSTQKKKKGMCWKVSFPE